MRRTQVYLDEDLWNLLHTLARRSNTTIFDLVRKAVFSQYGMAETQAAFERVIGLWNARSDIGDNYVRNLRRGSRMSRQPI